MTAFIVAGVLAVLLGVAAVVLSRRRDDLILRHWAEQNGFEIVKRRRLFFLYWFHTRGQALYRVEVRDRDGEVRTARVWCGGFLTGVRPTKPVVEWES